MNNRKAKTENVKSTPAVKIAPSAASQLAVFAVAPLLVAAAPTTAALAEVASTGNAASTATVNVFVGPVLLSAASTNCATRSVSIARPRERR